MSHRNTQDTARRALLLTGAGAGFLALVGCGGGAHAKWPERTGEGSNDDVAPPEDLMREHGVLNRILLIYEEGARRIEKAESVPIEVVARSADIIRRFIEGYHEKLEEDFLFPRFERAKKLVDLVATLRVQHRAGRELTSAILRLASPATLQVADGRQELVGTMQKFVRMYRPHEAREDTVLFPALRSIVAPKEFGELGERFEGKEHELFGKKGFKGVVEQVAALEQELGIYDLNLFTPA